MKISAIIVAYNEEKLISSIIRELKKQQFEESFEIILADGGSTDKTIDLAQVARVRIVSCRKGKAWQMNDAAKIARGEILFFVHADMQFPANTFELIQQQMKAGFDGGGFANLFDSDNDKIKHYGNWMNLRLLDKREQSDKGIFYGDNGIFVKKEVFQRLGGFKEIAIMEDYDFSMRMSKRFKTVKIREVSIIVSARRHLKTGFFKTRFQWIMIRKLYKWGVSAEKLAHWYKDIR